MNIVEEKRGWNPTYDVGASSILGTRKYQQDAAYYCIDSDQILAVVCDGMGGLEGGERASQTAIQQMIQDFRRRSGNLPMSDFLTGEVGRMDQAVTALRNERGKALGAGTTLVAASFQGDQMYWVSVGDSMIYLIRGDRIRSLNVEHNYRLLLKQRLDAGVISREEFDRESATPQADALISFLGMNHVQYIDSNRTPLKLEPGDIVVLCSDGIYKSLNESQVWAMATDNDIDMAIAADRLTDMAMDRRVRGQDNTTAVLIRYLGKQEDGRDDLLKLHENV
ncbi:MAG: serine/threonine-protein phosphatase [Clostridiales bacterium]|nr:serine/threonine-protein phosphatase [Clostridiales bacterium]